MKRALSFIRNGERSKHEPEAGQKVCVSESRKRTRFTFSNLIPGVGGRSHGAVPTIKFVAVIAVVGALSAYGVWQARYLLTGPVVSLQTPETGSTLASPYTEISGRAHNIASIQLNGRTIYTEPDGSFSEPLLLSPGYNVVQITARDKFGRTTTQTIQLVARDDEHPGGTVVQSNETADQN